MARIWRCLSMITIQVLENITVQIAKAALEKGNLCCPTIGTNVENLLDSNVPTASCVQKKLPTSISILEKFTP